MKQFLLVIGFVLGTVLFFNQSEKAQPFDVLSALTKEAVMEDSETKDMVEKTTQYLRLKGHDLISKLLEYNSITHHINYSALLTRNGYHVFALRKLLI